MTVTSPMAYNGDYEKSFDLKLSTPDDQSQPHRFGVVIGRFQPCHKNHIKYVISPALEQSDTLLILLGSSERPRTPKDPWTDQERVRMIQSGLNDVGHNFNWTAGPFCITNVQGKKIIFIPILDSCYSNNRWQMGVQGKVQEAISDAGIDTNYTITLFGVDRDESTFYLNMFPQWDNKTLNFHGTKDEVNGTMCREHIFSRAWLNNDVQDIKDLHSQLSLGVASFINYWHKTPEYGRIKEEYDFLKAYREEANKFKYPIVFQTTDNLIVCKGHILLVNRRSFPGKGLWALPGGFLDYKLSLMDNAIHVTKEKTKLVLRPDWLVRHKTFDSPNRSLRGRTITTAFQWRMPDNTAPQIEAGKNTSKVRWFQFCDIMKMSAELYEDHYDIIVDLLSGIE